MRGWRKMYFFPYNNPYQYPYYVNMPMNNYTRQSDYWDYPAEKYANRFNTFRLPNSNRNTSLTDYGPKPFVININEVTKQNNTFRTALWTGTHLQVTLMNLKAGEDIGLEIHPDVDQFLRVEQGQGIVRMGSRKDNLNFERRIADDSAIMIPAGTWHNVINTGNSPLKLYSIYAPPQHPRGTVHVTKADAIAAEEGSNQGNGKLIFGRTPDEWVQYTEFLVNEGLEDVKRGINALHILQEFILMGVLVGKGYSPERAYETVEEWERTGESKLLQQSKNM
ncbi:cupin domain-containing protein [Metabacillus fastidiosus]